MFEQSYILTQDIGLFSCKAALFHTDGTLIKSNVVHYRPDSNDEGWAWQSPELWWKAFCQNCHTLLAGISPADVKGICLCGQMMGCLPVDRSVKPLCDSITWDDQRSVHELQLIRKTLGNETIHRITGTCIGHSFALPQVLWLRANQPEIYENIYKILTCKDYINYRLTGALCTDESSAGFTQMYDLYGHCWSKTILDAFSIDENKLCEVVPLGSILGTLTAEAAEQTGLSPHTRVVQGLGDGRAPAIGCGLLSPGDAYINLGSCSWISQCTRSHTLDPAHSITKASYGIAPELYVNGGTTLAGRYCIDWFINTFSSREGLSAASLSSFLDEQVSNSPVGSRGLVFMPYLRGERAPWWSSSAGGAFIGLSSRHTRPDLCRSILEGVAFQLSQMKNRIVPLEPFGRVWLAGSAASPAWQQIFSDVLELEITSFDNSAFIGCIGCALVCGVALGDYKDYTEVARFQRNPLITRPIEKNVKLYQEMFPTFEDCCCALADISRHLCQL